MSSNLIVRAGVVSLMALCGSAVAGPDWLEQGDAGSTIGGAQKPTRPPGAPALTSIAGNLSEGFIENDYEDLYLIRITDPGAFSIRPAFADFDVVLYLFNITINGEGYGLLGNNDESNTSTLPKLTGASTDGTGVIISFPGDYVLAVTGLGRTPMSRTGSMFNLASNTEVSGADGPGGLNPLTNWSGVGQTGSYSFTMQATDFPVTPAPGAGLALVAGLGVAMGRRRR